MKIILTTLCIVMLTGCSTLTSEGVKINELPPTHLLEQCPDLPVAANGNIETLFRNHIEVRSYYEHCRTRTTELQQYILRESGKTQKEVQKKD